MFLITKIHLKPLISYHFFLSVLVLICLVSLPKNSISQSSNRVFRIDTNYVNPNPEYFFFNINLGGYYSRYKLNTKNWLGDINSPHFSIQLKYNKFGLGFNFKPSTNHPYQELVFGGEVMTHFTKLNVINTEFYLSYSLDFPLGLSLEPYLGINRVSFNVINEDEIEQKFNLNNTSGFMLGSRLNKYWRLQTGTGTNEQQDLFFSIFADYYYAWTNFKRVHERLDNHFYSWGFGVSFIFFIDNKK